MSMYPFLPLKKTKFFKGILYIRFNCPNITVIKNFFFLFETFLLLIKSSHLASHTNAHKHIKRSIKYIWFWCLQHTFTTFSCNFIILHKLQKLLWKNKKKIFARNVSLPFFFQLTYQKMHKIPKKKLLSITTVKAEISWSCCCFFVLFCSHICIFETLL